MTEIDRIHLQMERAFDGGAWHGPALTEILEGVDAKVAHARPIPNAHSIWEIVLHLIGTQDLVLHRLRGIAKELSPEEDWPPVPEPTEPAWQQTLQTLEDREARLRHAIADFPEDRLDQPLVPGGTSAYDNFHGHVQHTLYHAAQMGLLRKAVTGKVVDS